MKLGKKKLIVGMICLILCFSMTAYNGLIN